MDSFWKWMTGKQYATFLLGEWSLKYRSMAVRPSKQMLIGYMMEYMDWCYTGWQYLKMNGSYWDGAKDTDSRYKWLEAQINSME